MTVSFRESFPSVLSPQSSVLSPQYLALSVLALVLAAVTFESTLPPTINNNLIPHLDKIAHFFTFGIIAWLTASTICHLTSRVSEGESRFRKRGSPGGHLTAATASILLAVLLGLANEYIQSFTPGRLSELNDVLADMAGAFVFLVIWAVIRLRSKADSVDGSIKTDMPQQCELAKEMNI